MRLRRARFGVVVSPCQKRRMEFLGVRFSVFVSPCLKNQCADHVRAHPRSLLRHVVLASLEATEVPFHVPFSTGEAIFSHRRYFDQFVHSHQSMQSSGSLHNTKKRRKPCHILPNPATSRFWSVPRVVCFEEDCGLRSGSC